MRYRVLLSAGQGGITSSNTTPVPLLGSAQGRLVKIIFLAASFLTVETELIDVEQGPAPVNILPI